MLSRVFIFSYPAARKFIGRITLGGKKIIFESLSDNAQRGQQSWPLFFNTAVSEITQPMH
ncbi:hypothetical protein DAQ1742_02432 [Dickeya aquatica]|uniref:Uncharacterized protein n=1 Tax=Dickeya aquatica TaxID=1401087 RepID=A0A375AB86_9GAMM|nr:hypothetical protein DAQ1742_02432 [Dickeya aquatica]